MSIRALTTASALLVLAACATTTPTSRATLKPSCEFIGCGFARGAVIVSSGYRGNVMLVKLVWMSDGEFGVYLDDAPCHGNDAIAATNLPVGMVTVDPEGDARGTFAIEVPPNVLIGKAVLLAPAGPAARPIACGSFVDATVRKPSLVRELIADDSVDWMMPDANAEPWKIAVMVTLRTITSVMKNLAAVGAD